LALAVDFFADFFAEDFFFAPDFLADFFAEDFLADFLAVDFLADFLAAGMFTSSLSRLDQEAMRFRRRRSRSLIPPHTPYRSSRRRA
jgi:hypothetical protein